MKNTKKYMSSIILATVLCTSTYLSSMESTEIEPTDGPTTSSESGAEYTVIYTVNAKDKQILNTKLKEFRNAIAMLNEIISTKENEEYDKSAMSQILQQKAIYLNAIDLVTSMIIGEIPVDMNRIQEEMNLLIQ